MPKATRSNATGGPEVLCWEDLEAGEAGEGQLGILASFIGATSDQEPGTNTRRVRLGLRTAERRPQGERVGNQPIAAASESIDILRESSPMKPTARYSCLVFGILLDNT